MTSFNFGLKTIFQIEPHCMNIRGWQCEAQFHLQKHWIRHSLHILQGRSEVMNDVHSVKALWKTLKQDRIINHSYKPAWLVALEDTTFDSYYFRQLLMVLMDGKLTCSHKYVLKLSKFWLNSVAQNLDFECLWLAGELGQSGGQGLERESLNCGSLMKTSICEMSAFLGCDTISNLHSIWIFS